MGHPSSPPPQIVGYNYSANVALLLCMGPVQGLYQVFAADEQIWPTEGDPTIVGQAELDLTHRLSCMEARDAGRSYSTIQTSIGTIRFYWGFDDSTVDPDLAAITSGGVALGSPAYRGMCYCVGFNLQFGQSQSPPNLTFVIDRSLDEPGIISQWPWRWPYKTVWGPDAYLADIVASILSNPVYGAGLPLSKLNEASFVAANQDSDGERSGLSPGFDSVSTFKSILGDLLPYYNASLYYDNGQFFIQIPRPPTGAIPIIDMSMMTEEPDIEIGTYYDGTWNETRVTYTDRTMQFQTLVESYDDPANLDLIGPVMKQIDRKFISRQDLAHRSAESIGKLNGVPSSSATLVLRNVLTNLSPGVIANFPEAMQLDASTVRCSAFVPGQIIALNYPPRGIEGLIFRISKVTIGAPADGTVTLECASDASIVGGAALYTPAPPVTQPVDTLEPEPATLRIAMLTADQLNSSPDGMLVCIARPNGLITSYEIDANWNGTTDFTDMGSFRAFAIQGALNRWRRSDSTSRLLVDVSIASALDQAKLSNYNASRTQLYFVAMNRRQNLHTAVDEHQLIPGWAAFRLGGRFALVSPNRWEIEIEPGALGSTAFALEDFRTPADGYWPTVLCWIGTEDDFTMFTTKSLFVFRAGGNDPADAAENRIFRFPTAVPGKQQDQSDATALTFERLVTTMNPNGTFSLDWGPRMANKEYVSLVCADGATEYWRLGEASGATALNYLDTANDGTYSGAVTLGGASPLTLEVGDTSAAFNGTSGMAAMGNNTAVKLSTGTLELWVKSTTPGVGRRGLAVKLGAYGLYLFDGVPGWRDWNGGITDHIAATAINDSAWHHVVLTWQSGTSNGTKLYVDGVLVLTNMLTVRDQLSQLTAAAEKDQATAAAQFLAGSLDEIALYPTQLSLAQIQAHLAAAQGTW